MPRFLALRCEAGTSRETDQHRIENEARIFFRKVSLAWEVALEIQQRLPVPRWGQIALQ